MIDDTLTISRLAQFKNAGVWNDYSDSQGKNAFGKRNLIFGFNGSGKTTLSRIFASLEANNVEEKLPPTCEFIFEFSNKKKASAKDLSHPLKNNILVFNDDFVERNLLWSDSSANPIFYISKDSVEAVKELESVETKLGVESETLKKNRADEAKINTDFGKFKTSAATRVRELANVTKLSQTFTKSHLEKEYANHEFNPEDLLSETEVATLKEVVNQSRPLPKIEFELNVSSGLFDKIQKAVVLLSKTPSATLTADIKANIDALEWIGEGHKRHSHNQLKNCLFCENEISQDRMNYLASLFDTVWQETTDAITVAEEHTRNEHKRLRELYPNIPSIELFQPEYRDEYGEILERIQLVIKDVGLCLNSMTGALSAKRNKLSQPQENPEVVKNFLANGWQVLCSTTISQYEAIKSRHNKAHEDFAKSQLNASSKLKRHVLYQAESDYRKNTKALNLLEEQVTAKSKEVDELQKRQKKLRDDVREHGIAADEINNLLHSYLGHNQIKVQAKDEGYQLERGNGRIAEHLSEGEKTALAFCFFLAQVGAEGRNKKDLVLVIDDPVSSLDTSAKTHAFALLKKFTKSAAQVFILTHDLQFMHMVKRNYRLGGKGDPSNVGLFFVECIDCENAPNGRSSTLIKMPKLIADYESEYHYLFSIVSKCNLSNESEHLFLLPNAIRKMLEIFLAFANPEDAGEFSTSLMSEVGGLKNQLDTLHYSALERLVQVESHGTIDGAISLPPLTTAQSKQAAKAAMEFIRLRDQKHFKAMEKMVAD